jgi:sugar phosphate isomerase/epimerase
MDRRTFLALAAAAPVRAARTPRISLSEWSLERAIASGAATNLDFPRLARERYGIDGLEFATPLWPAATPEYVRRLKANIRRSGARAVLLLCDGEGMLGHSDPAERKRALANHRKWLDIAAELGCHGVRTNLSGDHPERTGDLLAASAESFAKLCGWARRAGLNVLIENHGGVSSDPDVLVRLFEMVSEPNFGALVDFGNFPARMDPIPAVARLAPYAKGVAFKCRDFAPDGRETTLDMERLMSVVGEAGYDGYVGIEYEGNRLDEFEGILAARRLLDRLLAA